MFDLIKNNFSNPMEDSLKLWKITIFNYLIGNTDNHIKNLSVLYSEDLKSLSLAPVYDIVSTKIYETSTDEMSLSINNKLERNSITRDDFKAEAVHCGLGSKLAMNVFDQIVSEFNSALEASMLELKSLGFAEVHGIYDKIRTIYKT